MLVFDYFHCAIKWVGGNLIFMHHFNRIKVNAMSNVGSISTLAQPSATVKPNLDTSATAASAITDGPAGPVAKTGSTVVNFSAEGLEKLGNSAQSGAQPMSGPLGGTGSSKGDAFDSADQSVVDLYSEVAGMAQAGTKPGQDATSSRSIHLGLGGKTITQPVHS
jgi:hypothetical protein